MLKKGISVFLSLTVLLLCVCSVPAFASEPEFDINDYSIEDLDTMTTAEKKELIANFIETYNPYGMQDLLEQEAQVTAGAVSAKPGIDVQWKSDSEFFDDGQQIATHQLITLEAFATYKEDFGFQNVDGATALTVALALAVASALPDYDEKEKGYAGHFYDPVTELGINVRYKTAKDNVQEHFDAACQSWQSSPSVNLNSETFATVIEELGRALHYIQDVCEPHHAKNLIAVFSTHLSFETYVENNIDSFLPNNLHISNAFYSEANSLTAGALAHKAAQDGASQINYVLLGNSEFITNFWPICAENCLEFAVQHSARLMHKLF